MRRARRADDFVPVGVSPRVASGNAIHATGSQSLCVSSCHCQPPSSIGWRYSHDGLAEQMFYACSTSAPEYSSATDCRRFCGGSLCLCSVGCVPQAFGCIAVPTDLEATIVCLTMPLRGVDDYAYGANLKILWRKNIALLIFLRMVHIFDLLTWLSSLIAN